MSKVKEKYTESFYIPRSRKEKCELMYRLYVSEINRGCSKEMNRKKVLLVKELLGKLSK